MTTFKSYRQNKIAKVSIQETTVPASLHHIDESWDHHGNLSDETRDKISKATDGKTFTTFPLNNTSHDVDADVASHLTHHNYQIKDYVKGIATIKKQVGDPERGIPMREKHVDEKIGSILEKTGASDDVKKAYINDPARAASKSISPSGGLHVVIAHSSRSLAGMSTGTNWKDQSCMNQEGGVYSHKLQDDSENGTHVAFLVHHDDVNAHKHGEPDNPIARIAIKPYHERENDHGSDTIFRPETKMYGAGSTSFDRAVSHWAGKNYPAKTGVEYTKNSDVYNDTGNTKYQNKSKEDVEKSIENNHDIVDSRGAGLDKEVIDHAIAHGKAHIAKLTEEQNKSSGGNSADYARENFVRNMSEVGNLNTQHVAALHSMSDPDSYGREALAHNHGDKFSTNAINDHVAKNGIKMPMRMMMNPKLPAAVVDQIHPNNYTSVRRSLLKPHHYDKVVDSYLNNESGSAYNLSDNSAHLGKEHIDKLVDGMTAIDKTTRTYKMGDSKNGMFTAMTSPHFTQEHHDKLSNMYQDRSDSRSARELVGNSKFATLKDVEKHPRLGFSSLASNQNTSSETQKAIKDKFVENASLPSASETNKHSIFGFSSTQVPKSISKHMTADDHVKLAESDKHITFEDGGHSEKHLEAIKNVVKKSDVDLGNHIDKKTQEDEHYDHFDGDDDHANHLMNKLDNHVEKYSKAIDNHIDLHVASGRGHNEIIHNHDAADTVDDHLNSIDKLKAYKTPNNANHRLEHEHYDDHVQEIHDRMEKIRSNTEDHEERQHHGW